MISQAKVSTTNVAAPRRLHGCPNCGGAAMTPFYEVLGVPVHSCLRMRSRAEALSYPRGDIELGYCEGCGFIANVRFDGSAHEYSGRYEETQGFSPTFNSFAQSLAERLVDEYNLRGRTVLEIGCGKGEFLESLCRLGAAKGIGIDPAYVPERGEPALSERIEVIRDLYSEKYMHLQADFICCRHTLEHIGPTLALLQVLRQSIGRRTDTVVFFEVPDVARVLNEGAFWDIYYEHCSYFSPTSLARVFRMAGFEVTNVWREYDEQYLLLAAVPALGTTQPRLPLEGESVSVEGFTQAYERVSQRWGHVLADGAAAGRRIVLWGSGSKAVSFLTTLGVSGQIEYVVDINPYRHQHFMPGSGQEIVAPEFLRDYQPDLVIAMNPIYTEEIQRDLAALGVAAPCVPVTQPPGEARRQ